MPRKCESTESYLDARSIPVSESGCILWTAGVDDDGYGQAWRNGKNCRAHRVAYELANGPIPAGMVVMHKCDVPACINPAHMVVGTNEENTADRTQKGRHKVQSGDSHYMRRNPALRSGNNCPSAVLVSSQVDEIRILLSRGLTQASIAAQFGVTRTCIALIAQGRTWKHHALAAEAA